MAINAAAVWEVQQPGSDNNGGGFGLGGNTYSIIDLAGTNANTATPSVSSATYTFVAGDVGDYLWVAAGANWIVGLYKIASVSAGAATLSKAVANTASPATGSASIDRSQKTGAFVAFNGTTDLFTTSGTSATITISGASLYTVTAADVGNFLNITGGTNFTTGIYQILSVNTGTNQWTLDRNCSAGAGAGGTGNMGGCLATIGKLAANMVGSNWGFMQDSASYAALGATTTFGAASVTPSNSVPRTRLTGYGTTRGDGVRCRLVCNAASMNVISLTNAGWLVENFDVDVASQTGSTALVANGGNSRVRNMRVRSPGGHGINLTGTASIAEFCEVFNGASSSSNYGILCSGTQSGVHFCWVHDGAALGIGGNAGGFCGTHNLVNNLSNSSSNGIALTNGTLMHNTVFNAKQDGFNVSSTAITRSFLRNNISYGNGRYGINNAGGAGTPAGVSWDGNAYGSNTSGDRNAMDDTSTNLVDSVAPYTNTLDILALGAIPFTRANISGTTYTATDLVVDNSNNLKVTSATYTFVSGDVGAPLFIYGTSWTPAIYTISSVSSGAAILSASPAATGTTGGKYSFCDFSLNNNNPGGAQLRSAGYPGAAGLYSSLPSLLAVGYPDFGVYRHQDPAAGGTPHIIGGGF